VIGARDFGCNVCGGPTNYSGSAITASISTRAPSGNDVTPTVLRAGGPSSKNAPYASFTSGNVLISVT
jgi:hypothetical protein